MKRRELIAVLGGAAMRPLAAPVVNLKTAKALGIALPCTIVFGPDEVIE